MDNFTPPVVDLAYAWPVVWLSAWAMVLLIADLFIAREHKTRTGWLAFAGVVVALWLVLAQWPLARGEAFPGTGMFMFDALTVWSNLIIVLTALVGILLSINFLPQFNLTRGEYYPLMLFSTVGMMLMVAAGDLVMVFIALEMLSIPLYILSAFLRPRPDSEESAMKYFLLGSFSSGFLLYGIALIYGATGSTQLSVIATHLPTAGTQFWPILLAGLGLLLVGFGFKIGAVPFHMWTPDVYQGAPTVVTAFMSVGAKIGGFAALLRVFLFAFPTLGAIWWPAVAVIAAATMILGNVMAMLQPNVKRMLGYSSIAHGGYVLMALAAAGAYPALVNSALSASLFYLFAYTFTNLGAFAGAVAVEQSALKAQWTEERKPGAVPAITPGVTIDEYAGLSKRNLGLALALTLFMLSLTGVPPTGGFTGKFFLLSTVITAALAVPEQAARTALILLAVVAVLTSVMSAFYYLRVVVTMFMRDGEHEAQAGGALWVGLVVCVLGVVVLGLFPGGWLAAMQVSWFGG